MKSAFRMSSEKVRVLKENENFHFNNAEHVSNERCMKRLRFRIKENREWKMRQCILYLRRLCIKIYTFANLECNEKIFKYYLSTKIVEFSAKNEHKLAFTKQASKGSGRFCLKNRKLPTLF